MYKRLVILCLLLPALIFAQSPLPDYFQVLHRFFSTYTFDYNKGINLGFAKKKDGWHVLTTDPAKPGTILTDQIFWQAASKIWQPLKDFDKGEAYQVGQKVTAFLNNPSTEYGAFGFERCRYYGYSGWDIDLIRDFDKLSAPNDTMLEALARAHSAYASRFLWYQYGGLPAPDDTLQRPLERLELPSDERVKKMINHFDKAIAYYKKIATHHADYTTVVGKAGMKHFNENFHASMQLQICNREKEAQRYLAQCALAYDDSIAAANMLRSMDQNAILFTYGDNDTYALMYLQQRYNIRTDVAVINTSLLGLAAYVEWLNRDKKVVFATPASAYGKKMMDVALYDNGKTTADTLLLHQFLSSRNSWAKEEYSNGETYQLYNIKQVYILVDKKRMEQQFGANEYRDTLSFETGRYLTMSDFILLDIIQENLYNRPIYFSANNPAYFDDYLAPAGVVYQLMVAKDNRSVTAEENFLTNVYKPPFHDFRGVSTEYDVYVHYHFSVYFRLIKHYLALYQLSKVKNLVKQCLTPFENRMPYYFGVDDIVSLLYKSNHGQLGDAMAAVFTKTITSRCLKKTALYYQDTEVGKTMLQDLKMTMKNYDRNTKDIDLAIAQLSDR